MYTIDISLKRKKRFEETVSLKKYTYMYKYFNYLGPSLWFCSESKFGNG